MKIVVTGKEGLLSTHLQRLDESIVGLSKEEYDITQVSITDKLRSINPDIVIHAAATTDSNVVNKERALAITTNIIGTAHIANYCLDNGKRLVYISTDYIYDGTRGDYKETDPILPYNNYAWTKLGGECSVRLVPNHTIIRTSFGSTIFPYDAAWDNLTVSKDYIDIIAPKILQVATSSFVGTVNIGTEPKSMYEYASRRNTVKKDSLQDSLNFSLNVDRYEQSFSN
tara:strand:+ start:4159 stop:4839 length:681 start_codon:yes stop_codon:yes gene_type:complete